MRESEDLSARRRASAAEAKESKAFFASRWEVGCEATRSFWVRSWNKAELSYCFAVSFTNPRVPLLRNLRWVLLRNLAVKESQALLIAYCIPENCFATVGPCIPDGTWMLLRNLAVRESFALLRNLGCEAMQPSGKTLCCCAT
jgi:hypothetical protein